MFFYYLVIKVLTILRFSDKNAKQSSSSGSGKNKNKKKNKSNGKGRFNETEVGASKEVLYVE